MPARNPFKVLGSLPGDISKEVISFFAEQADRSHDQYGEIGTITDQMVAAFATRPAKHLRGILAVTGYRMFGGSNHEVELGLARAFEAKQDELLWMDDIMDNSDERRGGMTLHLEFEEYFRKKMLADREKGTPVGDVDFGRLGRDFAYNTANIVSEKADLELLCLPARDPARLVLALRLFKRNMIVTGYGQAQDLFFSKFGVEDEKDIMRMYAHKTAHYSFINPLQVGAALADATSRDLEALRTFGWHAGIAYQLRDDYLGTYGDEAKTGKSALNDLQEGKMTVLMHHALRQATGSQRQSLLVAFGNKGVTEAQYKAVKRVMRGRNGTESERYVEQKTHDAADKAVEILNSHPEWPHTKQRAEAVSFLHDLMNYCVTREK